jgi:hypothetical protein
MEDPEITDPGILAAVQELARNSYDLETLITDFHSAIDLGFKSRSTTTDIIAIAGQYGTVISRIDQAIDQSKA